MDEDLGILDLLSALRLVTLLLYNNDGVVSSFQFQIFKKLSQDPVHTAIPSSVTPRQDTRLSCPASTPKSHFYFCMFNSAIAKIKNQLTCSFLSH